MAIYPKKKTKDEIWQTIKQDQTKIYGQSLLDAFVQTTDDMKIKHFMELDKELRNKISSGSIRSILLEATEARKSIVDPEYYSRFPDDPPRFITPGIMEIAEILGQYNMNKLTGEDVRVLLAKTSKKKDMASVLGKEKISKLSDSDINHLLHPNFAYNIYDMDIVERQKIVEIIMQYKENLTNRDILLLLLRASNKKEIAKIIGQERIDNLLFTPNDVFNFISAAANEPSFELAVQEIKDIFGKEGMDMLLKHLTRIEVRNLLMTYTDREIFNKQKVIELLGQENMNKLTKDDRRHADIE